MCTFLPQHENQLQLGMHSFRMFSCKKVTLSMSTLRVVYLFALLIYRIWRTLNKTLQSSLDESAWFACCLWLRNRLVNFDTSLCLLRSLFLRKIQQGFSLTRYTRLREERERHLIVTIVSALSLVERLCFLPFLFYCVMFLLIDTV